MSLFYWSVQDLRVECKTAIKSGDINLALVILYKAIERVITEPVCASQVFASQDLDELCLRIGRSNISSQGFLRERDLSAGKSSKVAVYIVSRLQRSGGHSRLVQDFIQAQPEKKHLILSTEVGGPTDKSYFANLFADNKNVQIEYAPRGNLASRLTWLQSKLLECQPEHVHLLNHHQDSVAVAALVPEMGLKGSFYHHGDHHLCLGATMRHLEHIDLHPMGYHYCRDELGLDNKYLPLTFEDKGIRDTVLPAPSGAALTTATAARSNKVEIPYYISYLDIVPKVLKVTGGQHVHIGKLTPWALRRIYAQMKKLGLDPNKFIYIKWTSSVWKTLQENNVDLYLASFPYGAGLTLIEALGAGIPVVMHQHMYSRVLSQLELAYPEAFSWSDPDKLLKYLAEIQPSDLKLESELARRHYETYHHADNLREFFRDQSQWSIKIPPLSENFKPRWDEWATWVEHQLNFSHLIYRFVYRMGRRARSFITQRLTG